MNIPKFLLLLCVALSITLVSIFTIQLFNHISSVKSSDETSVVPRASQEDTRTNDDGVIAPERQSQIPKNYPGDAEDGIIIDDMNEPSMNAGDAVPDEDEIVEGSVEEDAQFPGGQVALLKYIRDHVTYPDAALKQGVQGMVILRFVVERDGRVGEVQVRSSLSPECDREAIRVVKSMPRFIPAKLNGRPIRKWFTVPIRFIIQ